MHTSSSWMWCALVSMLLVPVVGVYAQQDTDGDGLLDAVDVNGFIHQQGTVRMNGRGLEDLDGLSQVPNLPSLDSITGLDLSGNSIKSIEAGDFSGFDNLQELWLGQNQITSIENGDFDGLASLRSLDISYNPISTIGPGVFEGLANLRIANA